ncbi:hypothetical protein J437_LFUL010132 [Ladona fulva]|uniref:Uncharacterized protein n=1 Tax=Ladona fulva TaxID=123851 RepID=A0A8K0KJU5_LADFU|nr:hypothetical protein J437_LFUL010132 [Ladona fulva]
MHQAPWSSRAIYSLKISLISDQFKIHSKRARIRQCAIRGLPVHRGILLKAPYQVLCFLKSMKAYKKIDKRIAKAALQKISQHLCYLTEVSVLSLFDDDVDQETKVKMVENLPKENLLSHGMVTSHRRKNFAVHFMESQIKKYLQLHFSQKQSSFDCLKIDEFSPRINASFQEARKKVSTLRAVNNTAERVVKLMQDFHASNWPKALSFHSKFEENFSSISMSWRLPAPPLACHESGCCDLNLEIDGEDGRITWEPVLEEPPPRSS